VDSSSTCVQHYGRRRSKHGTTQEQSPQERAYHCSQTKSVITKHAHGAAQRAQEYHGHEQVQHNTPDATTTKHKGTATPHPIPPSPAVNHPDVHAYQIRLRGGTPGGIRRARKGNEGKHRDRTLTTQTDGVGPGRHKHKRPTAYGYAHTTKHRQASAGTTAGREVSHQFT
jgi:hypothetical protein